MGEPLPGAASGWVCAVCGGRRTIDDPQPWRCPNATGDDRRHVLRPDLHEWDAAPPAGWAAAESNPYAANDGRMAWSAAAAAPGTSVEDRRRLVERLDERLPEAGGPEFVPTPLFRSDELSGQLEFSARGGVWIKDETGNVGGSHKARHLQSILLFLLATGNADGVLAIASCGNAAIAAATLARAAERPLDVYVPTWMDERTGELLEGLGARITRCARRPTGPPGDPAMFRFREAVEDGAVPFTVQGPENALCLDGGRTLGWEVLDQCEVAGVPPFDRVFAQVGGGAFAASLGDSLCVSGAPTRLHAVQAAGCAPLVRAWERARRRELTVDHLGEHWGELMTPWDDPSSLADGILDDETYDWLDVCRSMSRSGGSPITATERDIAAAHRLAVRAGIDVSTTGAAGLAGALRLRPQVDPDERILVVMTGTAR